MAQSDRRGGDSLVLIAGFGDLELCDALCLQVGLEIRCRRSHGSPMQLYDLDSSNSQFKSLFPPAWPYPVRAHAERAKR